MVLSKRECAALCSARLGFTALLERMPKQPLLMVLNYHRIGDPEQTPYDPGTFSTTAEEFDRQITCLKRRFSFTTLEEAVSIAAGRTRPRRPCVLITFDDGYLDNYTLAFPVLRSHGVQGVFFPTYFVGTGHVPWWDAIAYVVKRGSRREFRLKYPEAAAFDVDRDGLESVLQRVLGLFKLPAMQNQERFFSELEDVCGSSRPGESAERCFLSWQEAREMRNAGMAIGSHTHSHEILSKLPDEQQYDEVARSREILENHLGARIDTLAYPVGAPHTFSRATISALHHAGYRGAFSYYGGLNLPGRIDPFNIRRHAVDGQSLARLRLQTALGAVTGHRWF